MNNSGRWLCQLAASTCACRSEYLYTCVYHTHMFGHMHTSNTHLNWEFPDAVGHSRGNKDEEECQVEVSMWRCRNSVCRFRFGDGCGERRNKWFEWEVPHGKFQGRYGWGKKWFQGPVRWLNWERHLPLGPMKERNYACKSSSGYCMPSVTPSSSK